MKLVIAMHSSRSSIWQWPEWATARLRGEFPAIEFVEHAAPIDQSQPGLAKEAAEFAEADAVVAWRLDPHLWRDARRLRWIHSPSAAVHQLLTPELIASPIVVTNGASVHAATVAEHTLALLLALARRLPQAVRAQQARRWDAPALQPLVSELAGTMALIVGYGHIGRELEARLRPLGMLVRGLGSREIGTLGTWLPQADWVVLALPATPATTGLFGPAQLAAMRPGARLINVGRAAALDEGALLQALEEGKLAGAALDVFAEEPLPPESPLWSQPQLLITPHIAATTPHSWRRQVELIATHLRRFAAGELPRPRVDKHRGY